MQIFVKFSVRGGFAALAGAWGVPNQRFRISEKNNLKRWQRLLESSDNQLSELSNNVGLLKKKIFLRTIYGKFIILSLICKRFM